MTRAYGKKYDATLRTTDIAKKLRQELKAEKEMGKLPRGLKVSVTTEKFAGGSSITMEVTAVPQGFRVLNPEYVLAPKWESGRAHRYTKAAQRLLKRLDAMMKAYNHDGCDYMTDHFDVKFYSHEQIAHELEHAEEQVIKAMAALNGTKVL